LSDEVLLESTGEGKKKNLWVALAANREPGGGWMMSGPLEKPLPPMLRNGRGWESPEEEKTCLPEGNRTEMS
jgi:hypothetical protein